MRVRRPFEQHRGVPAFGCRRRVAQWIGLDRLARRVEHARRARRRAGSGVRGRRTSRVCVAARSRRPPPARRPPAPSRAATLRRRRCPDRRPRPARDHDRPRPRARGRPPAGRAPGCRRTGSSPPGRPGLPRHTGGPLRRTAPIRRRCRGRRGSTCARSRPAAPRRAGARPRPRSPRATGAGRCGARPMSTRDTEPAAARPESASSAALKVPKVTVESARTYASGHGRAVDVHAGRHVDRDDVGPGLVDPVGPLGGLATEAWSRADPEDGVEAPAMPTQERPRPARRQPSRRRVLRRGPWPRRAGTGRPGRHDPAGASRHRARRHRCCRVRPGTRRRRRRGSARGNRRARARPSA